jgi:hypothetical protein
MSLAFQGLVCLLHLFVSMFLLPSLGSGQNLCMFVGSEMCWNWPSRSFPVGCIFSGILIYRGYCTAIYYAVCHVLILFDPFHSICLKFWISGSLSLAGSVFFSLSLLCGCMLTFSPSVVLTRILHRRHRCIAVLIVQALFQERLGKISGPI